MVRPMGSNFYERLGDLVKTLRGTEISSLRPGTCSHTSPNTIHSELNHGFGLSFPVAYHDIETDGAVQPISWTEESHGDGLREVTERPRDICAQVDLKEVLKYVEKYVASGDHFYLFMSDFFHDKKSAARYQTLNRAFYYRARSPLIDKSLKALISYCLFFQVLGIGQTAGAVRTEQRRFGLPAVAPPSAAEATRRALAISCQGWLYDIEKCFDERREHIQWVYAIVCRILAVFMECRRFDVLKFQEDSEIIPQIDRVMLKLMKVTFGDQIARGAFA
ncbi:uncharacterized protein PV07_12803, partial [Cladophialophora immunda]